MSEQHAVITRLLRHSCCNTVTSLQFKTNAVRCALPYAIAQEKALKVSASRQYSRYVASLHLSLLIYERHGSKSTLDLGSDSECFLAVMIRYYQVESFKGCAKSKLVSTTRAEK